MTRHRLPGTDLGVSALCYGVMRFGTRIRGDDMLALYRRFREVGGNFFDTAHSYACWIQDGDGASERSLGECLRRFGDRGEVVIATKGAHPRSASAPFYPRPDDCMTPEVIASDISDSLARLGVDAIDLFVLHRDDPRHPVGEIVEALNAEIARGRIRHVGASNWSTRRLAEANRYAGERKLHGFVVSSPQWTLAHPNHAPLGWGGPDETMRFLNGEDVAWHRGTGLPVVPYTSTAYGYFSGSTSKTAMSFDNPVSRGRRERAEKLGRELGCTAAQVALAYLASHEFPVLPIVGTTDPARLGEALGADRVRLTPEQRDWLLSG